MMFELKGKREFEFFSAREITPTGWMRKQLETQAKSLSGCLDKIWPDIRDSKWIGGDGDGWERLPYWLDGFMPLAYLLDDEEMIQRVEKYITSILNQQQEDGWLCPCEKDERDRYDVWVFFLISKVLVQYHQHTGDTRIFPCLYKAWKQYDRHVDYITIINWGMMRWGEALITLVWLYEQCNEEWILRLIKKIRAQGFDYASFYQDPWHYAVRDEKGKWSQSSHVVNNAMALKAGALYYLLTGDEYDLNLPDRMLAKLYKYHSTVVGGFTGDECLAGDSPVQGTELCATVEMMYSLEHLLSVSGDMKYAEILESLAYNALPAAFTPDMWAHQYNTMSNQVQAAEETGEGAPFMTNEGDSHVYGFEPHFGCCTANFNQGWPKYALSAFMRSDDGIAITTLQPSMLATTVNGVPVTVEVCTMYPFRDKAVITVKSDAPVEVELLVRVPKFAKNPMIGGKEVAAGEFYKIRKVFSGMEEIALTFDVEPETVNRSRGLVAIKRGALVYSLKIKEECNVLQYGGKTKLTERKPYEVFPHCTYEYYPKSKFNYALASSNIEFAEVEPEGGHVFSPSGAPVRAYAEMVEISWAMENGFLNEVPESLTPQSPPVKVELIPFGCTNIRVTEFPARF